MARPQHRLDLGGLPPPFPAQAGSRASSGTSSPIDLAAGARGEPRGDTVRGNGDGARLGGLGIGLGTSMAAAGVRVGAGSPSHDHTGTRLYSRRWVAGTGAGTDPRLTARARELQAADGHGWGPPVASGLSTPLRETIPESPGDDSFPGFGAAAASSTADLAGIPSRASSVLRARAGTVPSRFPGDIAASTAPASSRATPSVSPHRAPVDPNRDVSSLLSRYRAGSMPLKGSLASGAASPFGPSIFSSGWSAGTSTSTGRARSSTSASHKSDGAPAQPSSTGRDILYETDMKTLSYLGLDDAGAQLSPGAGYDAGYTRYPTRPLAATSDWNRLVNSRFRSYSVNASEAYAREEAEPASGSGTLTPSAQAAAAAHAAIQAQIYQHNLDVQAFANQASSSRPRARTAGLLDSPGSRLWRGMSNAPSRLETTMNASDLGDGDELGLDSLHLNGDDHHDEATRALWLGGIPATTTNSALKAMFDSFGRIESARVLSHKGCGFVNYENIESAMVARAALNGTELFAGAGPVRIGYAKTPSGATTPGPEPGDRDEPADGLATLSTGIVDSRAELLRIAGELGAGPAELPRISALLDRARDPAAFSAELTPPPAEPSPVRLHDAARLREIRKHIDSGLCSPAELEEIAQQMLPEVAELAADYLGNTVVQKLFEHCSESTKEALLRELSPHLAAVGVHKNGTWAAQKAIDMAHTPAQRELIVAGLRPYAAKSFLDQYGNYVVQGCLKFGAPANDFVFECMLSSLWQLAEARFGARAIRACLESHHAAREHQRAVAADIAVHGVRLAANSNGALLLTWYLDTCPFRQRRKVLAARLLPHLVSLCTHKVAYMTVLKLVNQRDEPEARQMLLRAMFAPDDAVLEPVLKDQACGATLVFKVLTTPYFDDELRGDALEGVRRVLVRIGAQPNQGYKRLLDEVGLSRASPAGGAAASPRKPRQPSTPSRTAEGLSPGYSNGYGPASSSPYSPVGQIYDGSVIAPGFEQYGTPGGGPQYGQQPFGAGPRQNGYGFNMPGAGMPGMNGMPGLAGYGAQMAGGPGYLRGPSAAAQANPVGFGYGGWQQGPPGLQPGMPQYMVSVQPGMGDAGSHQHSPSHSQSLYGMQAAGGPGRGGYGQGQPQGYGYGNNSPGVGSGGGGGAGAGRRRYAS